MFYFCVSATDQSSSYSEDMKSQVVAPIICENKNTQKAVQADLPNSVGSEKSTESADPQLNTQPGSTTASDPPTTSMEQQPPSSPVMDLETDFPSGEISDSQQNLKWMTCLVT